VKTIVKQLRNYQRQLLDYVVRHHQSHVLDERARLLTSLFENHLLEKSYVLDIGGGWGFYEKPLAERGHQLTVLEVVRPGYQRAPVVLYDGNRIPFPDKSFDISMFVTVLHHIADFEKVIQEAKRVTKKRLIVVEDVYHHSFGRWWTVLRDRIYNFEYFGHPCQFRKTDEWIQLFERFGFELVEKKEIFTWIAGLRILNGVFVFNVGNGV